MSSSLVTLVKYLGIGSGASITFLIAWLLWQHFRINHMTKEVKELKLLSDEHGKEILKQMGEVGLVNNCVNNLAKLQDKMDKKLDRLIDFHMNGKKDNSKT